MIVRDEEGRLPRALASVMPIVDEIVIVDTGSVDGTRDVALGHGATVLTHDFTAHVDFSAARNAGLDHARGAYILVLDADETLDPGSVGLLRACVEAGLRVAASPGVDVGFIVDRHNHRPGHVGPVLVDHAVRLFPNRPAHRYRHRVHETVDDALLAAGVRLSRPGIVIDHDLLPDAERERKSHRYLEILLEELADAPDDVERLTFLAAEYHQLGLLDEATRIAERIARLRPDDAKARLEAALHHLYRSGDVRRARAEIAAALTLDPTDPEVAALLAEIDSLV